MMVCESEQITVQGVSKVKYILRKCQSLIIRCLAILFYLFSSFWAYNQANNVAHLFFMNTTILDVHLSILVGQWMFWHLTKL